MTTGPYRRVLLKLSGEVLMGRQGSGIEVETVTRLAREVAAVHRAGVELAIVIGGGNIFRGVAGAAAGMERAVADHLGILATVINSLALRSALAQADVPAHVLSAIAMDGICPGYSRDRALEILARGEVAVLAAGTGNPFFTTDTAATLRAAETGCQAVLKGTKVDGVYSSDPATDPGAQRYEHLSFDEVLARNLAVMDATAIALARDNSIPIIVFSIQRDGALVDAVAGRGRFTTIDGDGSP
jgi:uridylate kinase